MSRLLLQRHIRSWFLEQRKDQGHTNSDRNRESLLWKVLLRMKWAGELGGVWGSGALSHDNLSFISHLHGCSQPDFASIWRSLGLASTQAVFFPVVRRDFSFPLPLDSLIYQSWFLWSTPLYSNLPTLRAVIPRALFWGDWKILICFFKPSLCLWGV